MSQQIFTLAGTVIGAALGLFAPMVSSRAGRRERDRDLQRQIASDIMALFENGDSPVQILTPQESRPRRRLYILALRLESHPAREACMRLIVCAGKSPPDDDELLEAWDVMMNEVGAVYRRGRRGGS